MTKNDELFDCMILFNWTNPIVGMCFHYDILHLFSFSAIVIKRYIFIGLYCYKSTPKYKKYNIPIIFELHKLQICTH